MAEFDPGPPDSLAEHFARVPSPSHPEGLLVRLGADLLPRPPRRLRARAVRGLRPGADRADPRPLPGRQRGPAGPGLPHQARAHPLLRVRERVGVRGAPRRRPRPSSSTSTSRTSSPGATSSTTASPARSCRRSSRSARWRSARSSCGTRAPTCRSSACRIPPAATPTSSSTPGARRSRTCAASSRPTPTATTPARTTAPSSRRPTTPRSRGATSRSASPPSWATTPGCAQHGGQSAVSRPVPDDGHTLIWHAPKGS